MTEQLDLFEDNPEYEAFVAKFKTKKTTDDCYTPECIYETVKNWAVKEYGLEDRPIVRPFWPGGDYENEEYPENCVVIDNPPFSILTKIMDFFEQKEIDFFLFAPALTILSSCKGKYNAVITDSSVIYENGANVKTSFATNLGDYMIHVSSELHDALKTAQKIAKAKEKVTLLKYVYPDYVLTSATIQKIAAHGQTLKFRKDDCHFIRAMDTQKEQKKSIFGGGFLLSERAAAERAAAERAAAERAAAVRWQLSDRELQIIASLGGD